MPLSNYLANNIFNHALGSVSFTPASTLYAVLCTTAPAADGTGLVEVSGGSYARVAITNNTTNFPSSSGGTRQITNGTLINFGTSTGSWGSVVAVAFYDAAIAGNLYFWSTFTTQVVAIYDVFQFAANSIVVNF